MAVLVRRSKGNNPENQPDFLNGLFWQVPAEGLSGSVVEIYIFLIT